MLFAAKLDPDGCSESEIESTLLSSDEVSEELSKVSSRSVRCCFLVKNEHTERCTLCSSCLSGSKDIMRDLPRQSPQHAKSVWSSMRQGCGTCGNSHTHALGVTATELRVEAVR